jgi:hypothetical protein
VFRFAYLPLFLTALSLSVPAGAGTIYSQQTDQLSNVQPACPPECSVPDFQIASAPIVKSNGSGLFGPLDPASLATPLPSTWVMMLAALAMGFAAYRLFSVPD